MKQPAYLLLFVLLLNSLLWVQPRSIYSCQCPDFQPAGAVFTGRVTTITDIDLPYNEQLYNLYLDLFAYKYNSRHVTLTVTNSWKGVNTTQATVLTAPFTDSCGFPFVEGDEYLIYAYKLNNSWITSTCTGTSLITNQHSDLAFLATQPTLPLTTPFPWSTIICGLALFTVVALSGLGWHTWRKRKGEATPAA